MRGSIALFELDISEPTSWLIALATCSTITHAAVQVDGAWYDASEKRGDFDLVDAADFNDRRCYMIDDVEIDERWLTVMADARYDWRGVFAWVISRISRKDLGDAKRFYCFEAAHFALTGDLPTAAVSGSDLLSLAMGPEYLRLVKYGQFAELKQ